MNHSHEFSKSALAVYHEFQKYYTFVQILDNTNSTHQKCKMNTLTLTLTLTLTQTQKKT